VLNIAKWESNMKRGNGYVTDLMQAGWLIVVCHVLLMSVGGCAIGPQNVLVDLRPYESLRGEHGVAAGAPAKVRIEPVKDRREDTVGSLIGERTTVGNIAMGNIDMHPLPTEVIAQMLRTELTQMGYSVVSSDEQFRIEAQLKTFQVLTPATALYWDINGTIELDLAVSGPNEKKHEAHYTVKCTDRTYVYPSEKLIENVISTCVRDMGSKVRSDTLLARFLSTQ
jgi:hypothetical protein